MRRRPDFKTVIGPEKTVEDEWIVGRKKKGKIKSRRQIEELRTSQHIERRGKMDPKEGIRQRRTARTPQRRIREGPMISSKGIERMMSEK